MPIEMPKGLPFSVDTWSVSSKSSKRHHFLTHAHKDHSASITSFFSFPIYCTCLTKTLVLQHYPQLDASLFLDIEVGQSLTIDDPTGEFTVTAFDANHCPGAVMFLFEGKFGNILHTGDCRLTLECLYNLPDKYVGRKGKKPRYPLDCVFLDCTFGNFSQGMPSKHSAIQQVINCIWKHPDALTVYLTCDILGQEEILVNVSKTFGSKIYVDKAKNPECFKNLTLTVPEILCEDPSSRFHLSDGSPGLYERARAKLVEAKAALQMEPLIVRPSAQWYALEELSDIENTRKKKIDEAVKDRFGVWHLCYSMHSSKEELEWALELLAPRWVVSTTPSCRAMELDYVKKHCFSSKLAVNSSMWKLLDMTVEISDNVDALVNSVSCYPVLEGTPQPFAQTKSPVKQCSTNAKTPGELSLPCKSLPVTLFGRARLSLEDDCFSHGGCNTFLVDVISQTVSRDARQGLSDNVKDAGDKWERSREGMKEDAEVKQERSPLGGCNILHVDVISQTVSREARQGLSDDVKDAGDKWERSREGTKEDAEVNQERSPERKKDLHEVEKYQQPEVLEDTRVHKSATYSYIGSSGLSESVRKLYRSMNVPVPRPLPSLVDLMRSNKRAKM